ncbi:LAETG motif-containing sortase-dependent surface protein [Streptomyces sp. NPDC005566]|uniref:LAETG motif-containing sortase-dependent surface protein n=1 Tax=Streptomyces sp. NPDC005566 TaxID=3156886 RepID=UPI0033B04CA7
MQTHLSSRFAVRSSVIAAAVLLSVVAPVAVAGTAVAQQAGTFASATAEPAPRIDSVRKVDTFVYGERVRFAAKITNPSDRPVTGDQQTLVTFAYGKHVNAALEPIRADKSLVVLEQSTADGIRRVALGTAADGSLQALVQIGKGKPIAPGATITEDFYLTVSPSVPAEVGMGEFSLGSDAEPTGRRTIGFSMSRNAVKDKSVVTGVNGTPELTTGGKPVEFDVAITKGSSSEGGYGSEFFFVHTDSGDLDPQHVTVERRDAKGKWVAVRAGKQDQSVFGVLGEGNRKPGETHTYTLRLSLTRYFPEGADHGTFIVGSEGANTSFGFDVRHQGNSTTDPDVSRELAITVDGVQGVTPLKAGGAAEEFTATVINKGDITQKPHVLLEITDHDVKRRMAAGEVRIEQYSPTAKSWAAAPGLRPSTEDGHLMATVTPEGPTLAPGAEVTYKLRVSATSAMKAKAFTVDIEARAELSSTRKRLPFRLDSAAPQASTSASPAAPTGRTAQTLDGEMAKTGGGSSTPLLIGAAGVLVAIGAGGLLMARRRAL